MNAIPQPLDCSSNCVPSGQSGGPPGPQGEPGADGAAGADGVSAFALVANYDPDPQPQMPAEGDTVTINTTTSTETFVAGEVVYIETWGSLLVTAVPDTTSITVENLEDSGTGAYADNAAPGTALAAGLKIVPSGPQGVAGSLSPGDFLQSANNLNDLASASTSRTNLGCGTAAIKDFGVTTGQVPPVDDTDGSLTAGEAVFATASGLESKLPADARTALGLGTAAIKDQGTGLNEIPCNSTAPLVDTECIFATASGIQSLPAAAARAALGVSSGNQPMLLFRDEQSAGNDSGNFAVGLSTVPLNTEVVDTDSIGSISGNDITLPAGTYRYEFGVKAENTGAATTYFQGNLYNVTATAAIANSYGQVSLIDTAALNAMATGQGRFTLSGSTVIRLQATRGGGSTVKYGVNSGLGNVNIFSYLLLYKEV